MEKKTLHVMIIGAGTGGLCLAHGLKRAGIGVTVYERDRTRKDGLQGYRVGISPAGSYALKECLSPELYDLFVATCARPPRYFNMLTEQMSELLSMERFSGGDDPVDSEKSVSRMTLRQVLLTGLEDVVVFDKKFSHYEHYSDGRVIVSFEDGTQAIGNVLIGADGAGSRLRKQRLPHAQMEETGILSIGGKLPITPESRALISDKVFNGVSLVMAPKGFGAILHVMEFKWDHAGLKNNIGGNDAELISHWPGMLYDNTQDYIMWGIWGARKNLSADPTTISRDQQLDLARKITEGWHPNFRRLIDLTDPSTVFPVNIRTSVPLEPWETSNVTLLGDAVHTMTPGRGVGANTALRDAALLCRRLIEVRDSRKPLLEALHEYEVEMLTYSKDAVLESRKQMDASSIVHKPVLGRLQLAVARAGMRLVNAVPLFKRKMMEQQMRLRTVDQVKASLHESHGTGSKIAV
jgi:2-polyprenyl-6-methoxyphenol hydroxylase-like FAD-dependent oxidoreductase